MSGGEAHAGALLAPLPSLPRVDGEPVFAEPWQAQAFALAVRLSADGHFTWKEWTEALGHELATAARQGEQDDGSQQYYIHWVTALERLVNEKGLADTAALTSRKDAWTEAFLNTPHGRPVVLPRPVAWWNRWLVPGIASLACATWLVQSTGPAFGAAVSGLAESAGLGTLLGMRHALEPDHLAALSTLLTGERDTRKAAWLGAYWGMGHTLTLLAAGTLLVTLRAAMPAVASDLLACAVALLLIGFGFRAVHVSGSAVPTGLSHTHTHGPAAASAPAGPWTLMKRPLLVGAVHGLAGSGALTAMVMATIPSTAARLAYLALFGIGSTLGMAALSGLLGWPIARVGTHGIVARGVSLVVGCVSMVLGLYWGYPVFVRLL